MTSALKLDTRFAPSDLTDDAWKNIRHSIYQANLANHVDNNRILKILDIGGGEGGDAIPMALQGHEVILADESPVMIERARKRAKKRNIKRMLNFHHVSLERLAQYYPDETFDMILCHNVIEFLDNMPQAMKTLSRLTKPGGMISIISIKRYKDDVQSMQLRRSINAVGKKDEDDKIFKPIFDPRVRRFPGNMVIDALQFADCDILGLYDVRCIVDYADPTEVHFDPELSGKSDFSALNGERTPYYVNAHFFHIVAEKL